MQAMWCQMWEPRQDIAPLNDFVSLLLSCYHLHLNLLQNSQFYSHYHGTISRCTKGRFIFL